MTRPAALILVSAVALAASCSVVRVEPGAGGSGTGGGSGGSCTGPFCACGGTTKVLAWDPSPEQVDLLLVIDNGPSMAEKQRLFVQAVPELVQSLVNPPCVDAGGVFVAQPNGPLDACPAHASRAFVPVADMHVGVVSSSLGTFGADGCPETPPPGCGSAGGSIPNDDRAHLLSRADPCGLTTVPTYESQGFLALDTAQKLSPPGEPDPAKLAQSIQDIVLGVGSNGCDFRSQNEAWYRFLADPAPWQSIALVNGQVQRSGVDATLLAQRQAFLRPRSLLLIVTLTDKDDGSLKESGAYPLFAQVSGPSGPFHLPHATTECQHIPTLTCCTSCALPTPQGCTPDPACQSSPMYTDADEDIEIRKLGLVDDRARYGVEFRYSPQRYGDALQEGQVLDESGHMVPNPIYASPDGGGSRGGGWVILATITGVPWQLIARQKNGVPDLLGGVSTLDPTQIGGFKSVKELESNGLDLAGIPDDVEMPHSPYMKESTVPRTGSDPLTGIAMAPPGSPSDASPINGHERDIPAPPGDIEYACVFPLAVPRDCSAGGAGCDCAPGKGAGNPLCAPNPGDGGNPTLQVRDKAYPAPRNLAIGFAGVIASICPAQITDPTSRDYGYRPAVRALTDGIVKPLHPPSPTGDCLDERLTTDAQGRVACTLIEVSRTGGSCPCDGPARAPLGQAAQCYAQAAKQSPDVQAAVPGADCFCEVTQSTGAALAACQNQASEPPVDGYCYIDAAASPPIGNPSLLAPCMLTQKSMLRFVGAGSPAPNAAFIVGCP